MSTSIRKSLAVICSALIGSFLLVANLSAQTQATETPVPKAPYLAPVPESYHWIETMKMVEVPDKAGAAKNASSQTPMLPSYPRSIDQTKARDTQIMLVKFDDGTVKRFAQKGIYVLVPSSKGPQLLIPFGDTIPYALYSPGFGAVSFVGPESFKEYVKYKGIPCFHYKQEGTTDFSKPSAEAWIAVETMLPVTCISAGIEIDYQFLEAPAAVVLSAEELAVVEKQEKAVKAYRAVR